MRIVLLTVLVWGLASSAAHAKGPVTIAMLAEKCQAAAVGSLKADTLSEAQEVDAEWCRAYMRGVHDMNGVVKAKNEAAQGYCFPDVDVPNLTYLVRVFVSWAEKNPDKADLPAAQGVVEALHRIFPC